MISVFASHVTPSRRCLLLAMMLFAGCIAVLGAASAQQAPPADAANATSAPEPAADAAAQPQPADEKSAPAGAATGQPKGRFEPTEKVRADFDVSFPVDI